MGEKEEYTAVQVTKETRKKLQDFRITNRESYNEVIIRLIKAAKVPR